MSVEVEHGEVCCHDHKKYQEDIYGVNEKGELKEKEVEFLIKDVTAMLKDLPQKGKTVVDIGCGPCVHSAVALSAAFQDVYMAEFREDGRELVGKWRQKAPDAFNWDPVLKIVAREEGSDVEKISARGRERIKGVVFADVHKPRAALPQPPEVPEKLDAVASFGVVSVASNTFDQYKNAMKNVTGLVKPGGLFIYSDMLQPETPAKKAKGHGHSHGHGQEGDHHFSPHGVPLNATKVKPVLEGLGMKILSYKEYECWGEEFGEFLTLCQASA